jgi:hypothetical protein
VKNDAVGVGIDQAARQHPVYDEKVAWIGGTDVEEASQMYCLPKFDDVFFIKTADDIQMWDSQANIGVYPRELFKNARLEDVWNHHRQCFNTGDVRGFGVSAASHFRQAAERS